jgi:hypothetical protein
VSRTAVLGLLCTLGLCLLFEGPAKADIKLSGYTQARINFWDGALDKSDDFDLRRVRLKAEAPVNDQGTQLVLQIELAELDDAGGGNVTLKDAKIEHRLSDRWSARLGYAKMPFGFDVPYSSSKRLPLERSQAARRLFPGERDTGLYFTYVPPRANVPKVAFGYGNGVHEWRDSDKESHAALLALEWPLPNKGAAGVSYMDASRVQTDPNTGQNVHFANDVWGAHVRWNGSQGINFQAEAFGGKLLGVNVDGWYSLAEVTPRDLPATVFYRYDTFDDGLPASDLFRRHTLGVASDIAEKSRVTAQWECYHDSKGGAFTNYGLQWQVEY